MRVLRAALPFLMISTGLGATIVETAQFQPRAVPTLAVSVTASPADSDGRCPLRVDFTAVVLATTGGTIKYQWLRSDGALGSVQSSALQPGKNVFTTSWTVGSANDAAASGWQALRILDPQVTDSNHASFDVRCVPDGQRFRFAVDQSLKATVPDLPPIDSQPRRVATLVGPSGTRTDFVEDEVVVMIDRDEIFDRFLRRTGGRVLWSLDTSALKGVPPMHLVRVNGRAAEAGRLESDLRSLGARGAGSIRVSSEAGLKLLALAAAELGRRGIPLSINFLAQPTDFLTRRTAESPVGPGGWDANAFKWPYMSRRATDPTSVQDIGVGDAWRALHLRGLLSRRIDVAVLDAGFQRTPDSAFDLVTNPLGGGSPGAVNPFICQNNTPCPWHGANVVTALAGLVDNGIGAAGPAGPVARVTAVERGGPDFFFGIANALMNSLRAMFSGQGIVNMSFSAAIDAVPSLFVIPVVDPLFAAARRGGTLIVASAGNDGQDVDASGVFGEGVYRVPCESPGVLCVGGLGPNSRAIHPNSNFGSAFGRQGDFQVWVAEDPSDPPFTGVKRVNGTSVASPFVAGVAALVAAANPRLNTDQIESVLLGTMNRGLAGEAPGWVNAFAAVTSAMPGGAPRDNFTPTISILSPRDGTVVDAGRPLVLNAAGADREGPVQIEWSLPEGTHPSGPLVRHTFTRLGEQRIVATVTDSDGLTARATATVQVINAPPVPDIQWPRDGARILAGSRLTLHGVALDRNEGPGPYEGAVTGSGLVWTDDRGEAVGAGEAVSVVLSVPGWHHITLRATDSFGATVNTTVDVEIVTDPSRVTTDLGILLPADRTTIVADRSDPSALLISMRGASSFSEDTTHVWYADWVDSSWAARSIEIARDTLGFSWRAGRVLPHTTFLDVAIRLVAQPTDGPPISSSPVRLTVVFPPD